MKDQQTLVAQNSPVNDIGFFYRIFDTPLIAPVSIVTVVGNVVMDDFIFGIPVPIEKVSASASAFLIFSDLVTLLVRRRVRS